jgi:hypothetical protein
MEKSIFKTLVTAAIYLVGWLTGSICLAAIPAPPVNQQQGIPDHFFSTMTEPVCRACHNQNPPPEIPANPQFLPDRHHMKLGLTIPPYSDIQFPDGDNDGIPEEVYTCRNCHELLWDETTQQFNLSELNDCMQCHVYSAKGSVHHRSVKTAQLDCKACHGGLVNNHPTEGSNPDGHYMPAYEPSLLTPWPSGKIPSDNSLPPSSAGTYPGNCDYCHNTADGTPGGGVPEPTPIGLLGIDQNTVTHHNAAAGLMDLPGDPPCMVCHNFFTPREYAIRKCENCHGVDTLHSIAADTNGDGFKFLREESGYSHVGSREDCWGCHGNSVSALNNGMSIDVMPSINTMNTSSIIAGTDTVLLLSGANFTNKALMPSGDSVVQLTDNEGNITILEPTYITDYNIEVLIPGAMAPGSYRLVTIKQGRESNPLNLTIRSKVTIDSASCHDNVLTISGSGFGSYSNAANSGTAVTMDTETGKVTSWSNAMISAQVTECATGANTTVSTIFGSASTTVQ